MKDLAKLKEQYELLGKEIEALENSTPVLKLVHNAYSNRLEICITENDNRIIISKHV